MDALTHKHENDNVSFSATLPLCLLAVSLIIILGWQMTVSVQQYIATIRMVDQQEMMATQASQAETKLQALMTDLLELAKKDPEAKAIVTKYRVKLNADRPSTPPLSAVLPNEKPKKSSDDADERGRRAPLHLPLRNDWKFSGW